MLHPPPTRTSDSLRDSWAEELRIIKAKGTLETIQSSTRLAKVREEEDGAPKGHS